jgi:predicted nucleic acid-binding protein
MSQVFIDTHALIAIASTRDMDRARVPRVLAELEARHAQFITTDAILTEFCNAMARSTLRRRGAQTVRLLQARDDIEIIDVTRELFERALILFEGRPGSSR